MAWAPIHVAAVNNDPDALARALAAGAAPDLKEVPTYGHARTPLLLVREHTKYSCEAAEAKAAQCVAMLLDAGASVTEQNNQGQLPLHLAVQGNFPREFPEHRCVASESRCRRDDPDHRALR